MCGKEDWAQSESQSCAHTPELYIDLFFIFLIWPSEWIDCSVMNQPLLQCKQVGRSFHVIPDVVCQFAMDQSDFMDRMADYHVLNLMNFWTFLQPNVHVSPLLLPCVGTLPFGWVHQAANVIFSHQCLYYKWPQNNKSWLRKWWQWLTMQRSETSQPALYTQMVGGFILPSKANSLWYPKKKGQSKQIYVMMQNNLLLRYFYRVAEFFPMLYFLATRQHEVYWRLGWKNF